MIRLRGHLICMTTEEAATVRWHLADHVRLSRQEPGCISFNVEPTDDPMKWEVDEAFTTRETFDGHQLRTRESEWFKATRSILRDFRVEELGD
jgi:quinol monooxygenase YgiN